MKIQKPLLMLFAGSDGVGKQESAMQIAHMLLDNGCGDINMSTNTIMSLSRSSQTSTSCADCNNAILALRGIDYALDDQDGGNEKNKGMVHQILNHIHARDGVGAVIIISHGENLSRSSKLDLVRLLGKSSVSFKKMYNGIREWGHVYGYESLFRFLSSKSDTAAHEEVVNIQLGNCVFIVTSNLGADKIFNGIRTKMSSSSWSGLVNDKELYEKIRNNVMEDVGNQFGQHVSFAIAVDFLMSFITPSSARLNDHSRLSSSYRLLHM